MKKDCKNCINFSIRCAPQLSKLDTASLIEWVRRRQRLLGLTRAQLSEKSGVPLATLNRMFTEDVSFRYDTIHLVIRALLDDPDECFLVEGHSDSEFIRLESDYQKKVDYLKSEIASYSAAIKKKDRLLTFLAIAVGILGIAIVAMLVADMLIPGIGFFWR